MPAASRDSTRPSRGARRKITRWRAGLTPLPVEPHQDARRQAQEIEREAAEVAQRPPQIAAAPVARRRGDGIDAERGEPAPPQAPDEVDILHQRQRPEAADRA